jgi:DNA gyrase subunit A
MAREEQFVLTVTAKGFGKRSSAYEYRVAGRGGQGIANIDIGKMKDNSVISSFPVEKDTELVMMTDGGQLIRTGVSDVRIAGRSTRGVTLFRVAKDENVVTVTPMQDDAKADENLRSDGSLEQTNSVPVESDIKAKTLEEVSLTEVSDDKK